ncbi:MAG: magnesium transporter [Candidatus Fermentibacteraceae bacterium]
MNPFDADMLRDLLARADYPAIAALCAGSHPATAADVLEGFSPEQVRDILRHLEDELRADVFTHFSLDFQVDMITLLKRREVARLMTDMPPDDRADLFKSLPGDRRQVILPAMAQAEREDIRRLTAYEEGTAGAVMTSDYASLQPDLTACEAIERLREIAPDRETIYTAFVVDGNRKLLGHVSLKDLIVARREKLVGEMMETEVISARVCDDREDAARKIQKYDLIALPVVDSSDALVGIITHDDALDIITQEHTEDMEKFMAIAGSHDAGAYLRTSSLEHFRNRVFWVTGLAMLGLVSGFVIQSFQGLLLQFAILAAFIPMLAGAGGNTGSQAATLVIRALSLKELSYRDVGGILWKEFRVALMLGVLLGLVAYARVMLIGGGASIPAGFTLHQIGSAIALALALQVVTSTLAGAMLPLGASRLRLDPAVVASPVLASFVDITGVVIYFMTVKLVLGI